MVLVDFWRNFSKTMFIVEKEFFPRRYTKEFLRPWIAISILLAHKEL